MAGFLEMLEDSGLFRGKVAGDLGAMDQLNEHPQPRPRAVAGAGGHHGVEHLTPSAKVVIGHPARQAQQMVVEKRFVVENLGQFLDGTQRRRLGEADAVADGGAVAAAEGSANAHADFDGVFQIIADGVSEGVIERPVENDVGEQAGERWGRRFVQAEQVALNDLSHERLRGRKPSAQMNTV